MNEEEGLQAEERKHLEKLHHIVKQTRSGCIIHQSLTDGQINH